jgi:hypothetical protein
VREERSTSLGLAGVTVFQRVMRFLSASITSFQEQINSNHDPNAYERHQQNGLRKIGGGDHQQSTGHRHPGLLLFPEYEVPNPDRAPDQGRKKKVCVQQIAAENAGATFDPAR